MYGCPTNILVFDIGLVFDKLWPSFLIGMNFIMFTFSKQAFNESLDFCNRP